MFLSVLVISTLVSSEITLSANSEISLVRELLKGYDAEVRPVKNDNDVINVTVYVNTFTLLDVDQAAETITFNGEFILTWFDAFLGWNRSEYDFNYIKMKENDLWRPDTVISTGSDYITLIDDSQKYVDVRYDGQVRQSYYGVWTNLCAMKMNRFPYDTQHCSIELGPWTYTSDEVMMIAEASPPEQVADFTGNSEWDFENITESGFITTDPDVNFHYSNLRFLVELKRRPQFYIWVLLVPTFIITTVCIFGLFTPTNCIGEREEKVNLGMTTLLSSAVILQIIAQSMPKTSSLPLLGNYILAEIFVVAIGVLCSVLILVLHQRANTRSWMPPRWMLAILRMTGSRSFLQSVKKSEPNIPRKLIATSGILKEIDDSLVKVTDFLEDYEEDRMRDLCWMKFFDRIDIILMIVFQVGNALVTAIMCKL